MNYTYDTLEEAKAMLGPNEIVTNWGPDDDGGIWVSTAHIASPKMRIPYYVLDEIHKFKQEQLDNEKPKVP